MKIICNFESGRNYREILLVKGIEEKETKGGKPYVIMTLTDGEKNISVKKWNTSLQEVEPFANTLCWCDIAVSTYKDDLDFQLNGIKETTYLDNANISDYIKMAPENCDDMFDEIISTLELLKDKDYSAIAIKILSENQGKFMKQGAAKSVHHSWLGGLCYHTARMLRLASMLCYVYPSVNSSLLISAAALHDIGKLYELETDDMGNTDYTKEGNLLGHLLIGCDMIRDAAKQLETPEEKVLALRHLVASHHGNPEWGAIERPACLEAWLLHLVDDIDAKVTQFEGIYEELEPGAISSSRVLSLNSIFPYRAV